MPELYTFTNSFKRSVSASLSAENTFTAPWAAGETDVTLYSSGTWVGTLTLQRSFDFHVHINRGLSVANALAIAHWEDMGDTTSNYTQPYAAFTHGPYEYYRLGFKTGNYTSGTANVRIAEVYKEN